jgi:hypothetical protein
VEAWPKPGAGRIVNCGRDFSEIGLPNGRLDQSF